MSQDTREDRPPEFRRRPEVQLSRMITRTAPTLGQKQVQALIKELEVHQLELEMQNLELEKTRLEAEESRDRYHDLFESAPAAYCTMDGQGLIQTMNGAAERLLVVDRKTVIGHPFSQFVADDQVPLFILACRTMLRLPGHHEHDTTLNVGGVGKTVLIDGCAITHADDGQQLRFALTDLTARQHVADGHREDQAQMQIELTDTKLLQSIGSQLVQEDDIEVLYEKIIAAAMTLMHSDMACMQRLDQDALRMLASRGFDAPFDRLFGLTRDDMQTSCSMAKQTGTRVIVHDVEMCDFLMDAPALADFRMSGIRAVQSTPLLSRNGHLVGMLSTHWRHPHCPSAHDLRMFDVLVRQAADLIDRQQVMEALRASEARFHGLNGELELRVAERTRELTASEDRLRALASELNLAEHRERTRLTIELHDHLAQMLVYGILKLEQARKAAELIPQCANLIQEGKDALTTSLTYTRTLIADLSPPVLREFGLAVALQWLAGQMQKYDLVVHVDAPESAAAGIPEDRAVLLFQSVRELLINIAKHARTDQARVCLQCSSGALQLAVTDEGCGFEVLYATTAASAVAAPSKFGLFSIRERMKALGGSFEIVSVKGKGTTATLILPLAMSTESTEVNGVCGEEPTLPSSSGPATSSQHSPEDNTVSTIRVLLVDDHLMLRQGLRSVINGRNNMQVVAEASNGLEAIEAVRLSRPDVVVMDINMPQMNGIEATKRIKSEFPDTSVIGLSVEKGTGIVEKMHAAGICAFLAKETAVDALCQSIEDAVARKQ